MSFQMRLTNIKSKMVYKKNFGVHCKRVMFYFVSCLRVSESNEDDIQTALKPFKKIRTKFEIHFYDHFRTS